MKLLIILAGCPGTGKSYLANIIMNKFESFKLLELDYIKELYFDLYGFNNEHDKEQIVKKSTLKFYNDIEKLMIKQTDIIIDYPFSDKQKSKLDQLRKQYDYKVLTIRLIANFDLLYDRRIKRDLRMDRHIGHLVSKYSKGMVLDKKTRKDLLISYEDFLEICTNRAYDKFELGNLIELDVNDFQNIDYENTISKIQQLYI